MALNLVIESPALPLSNPGSLLGEDQGENNLAGTNAGKIIGSKNAKQKKKKVSGKKRRRVSKNNCKTAKAIVPGSQKKLEPIKSSWKILALIRKCIKILEAHADPSSP
jgi:hypothetical protein